MGMVITVGIEKANTSAAAATTAETAADAAECA
jgi:hypothetical protein